MMWAREAQGAGLRRKGRDERGFTLMEMLVVVAIIGVMVAIAIPVFSGHLARARAATDAANIRAGYADLQARVLLEEGRVMAEDGFEDELYLQSDGTVGIGNVSLYQTVGSSEDLEELAGTERIGGLAVGSNNNGVTWEKNQKIVFKLDADTGELLSISGED